MNTKKTAKLRYVGFTERKTDCVAGTDAVWNGPGDIQEVPIALLKRFTDHPDVWQLVEDDDNDGETGDGGKPSIAELDALRERAKALGITAPGNWGKPRLTRAIEEAEQALAKSQAGQGAGEGNSDSEQGNDGEQP